ncbi:hypothetical protein NDU88_009202 [Pleurodeles waltl]|uniref:Uncharacterized protein n=1 Tax=Pleurodeles waltl TaxID=8319 RepID=A0AAV7P1M5_PLEWA|nr:hypothetical protein NDU88_009202 [Pleurodeles waltl]
MEPFWQRAWTYEIYCRYNSKNKRKMPCDRTLCAGLRGKCPGGTSQLVESVQEGAGWGHSQNAPCQKNQNSVCKKEEDRNARQAGSSEGEMKSQPGDGGTWRQRGRSQETRSRWLKGKSYNLETVRRSSPEGNRYHETKEGGHGGAGHVLGRTWPEQVRGVYWG